MKNNGISPLWKVLLPLLPIAAALFALCAGRMSIGVGDVLASVWAKLTGGEAVSGQVEMVLWKIRFPRILLALLVGAGLSVSGAAFQSLFSNPLASPDTLGVAGGQASARHWDCSLSFRSSACRSPLFSSGCSPWC